MYLVKTHKEELEFDSRPSAIDAARELSSEQRGQVEVQGDDENMIYVGGVLQTYRYRAR